MPVTQWPPLSHWNETCDNTTNADLSTCYGYGECRFDKLAGYHVCECREFYDPLTFCHTSIFDAYKDHVFPVV